MTAFNASNERVKRRYACFLKESEGLAASTIDHALRAIHHYEKFTGFKDLKKWSLADALAYKESLRSHRRSASGQPIATATFVTKLGQVQRFFHWLADQPQYRARIKHAEVNHLNASREETALAHTHSRKPAPTLEEAQRVIAAMPCVTDIELRDRAVLACAFLTGARVSALITLKLKHVRPDGLGIFQDAQEVRTKFAKSQDTIFFPVGEDIRQAFLDYVEHLRRNLGWSDDDPLFPATQQQVGDGLAFHVTGLSRAHWRTPDPIRKRFKHAFEDAGVPYFPPHRARNCLTRLGQQRCRTVEELKVWSQNSGHESVMTTLRSYGFVEPERHAEILAGMWREEPPDDQAAALGKLLLRNPEFLRLVGRGSPEKENDHDD